MTSTNDEKDVKSNQTSGPKGKTYYIEIYKSLEAALSSAAPLSERTEALCAAWGRVHRLCAHSASATHAHLLTWLQRHTARTILQTEWQSPGSAEHRASLDRALASFIQEAKEAAAARNGGALNWEAQLGHRAEWFRKTLPEPWGHPVLRKLLDQTGTQPKHEEVLEWLKEERGVIFVTRLRQLASSKCNDLALALATAIMERVRATAVLDEEPSEESGLKEESYRSILSQQAGFTADVWELLVDLEFVLLHKLGRTSRCIELAKQTPLRTGYQLVERLRTRLETSPREKKLWKNGKDVATIIAQVIVTRCMVTPACSDAARAALYCCARSLVRLLPAARLAAAAAALAAPAATPHHLHTLAAATRAQCTEEMKPFVCELYVRAITAGMNELERLKHVAEKESEARSMEQTLASWFVQLGALLAASARIQGECALTAFSMHPSAAMLQRVKDTPPLQPLVDKQEPVDEPKSEFGSWASDSHGQSNFVKTSETLKLKGTRQANVLSTALLNEGEALGLSAELCQDIAALLSGPRLKTLSWDMDREKLLEVCGAHMERTDCGTRALTTELRYLNVDPRQWQHLPEEDDGEGDLYYGIERGYEHLVELPEPEPEEIWADALSESDATASADSSSMEQDDVSVTHFRKKKNRSRKSCYIAEENDPLSLTTERNEWQPSREKQIEKKEKSKKEKPKTEDRNKSKSRKKRETSQERRKEMKAQKKREKKERKKLQQDDMTVPKPVTSLSSLIGLKVCSSEDLQPDLKMEKNLQKEKKKKPPPEARLSSESDSQVVYDGQFSMDELKTPSPIKPPSPMKPLLHADVLTKQREAPASPIVARNLSPVIPAHSPSPSVHSPGYSVKSPVSSEVKERISKLLAFRRQRNANMSPLSSPSQSFVYGPPSTSRDQDYSNSSGSSAFSEFVESTVKRYPQLQVNPVPKLVNSVITLSTSANLQTHSQLVDNNTINQPHSNNLPANQVNNIPATVTSQTQLNNIPATVTSQTQLNNIPATVTSQTQLENAAVSVLTTDTSGELIKLRLPKCKQKPPNPTPGQRQRKPPATKQTKPGGTVQAKLPGDLINQVTNTQPAQKIEHWQSLLEQVSKSVAITNVLKKAPNVPQVSPNVPHAASNVSHPPPNAPRMGPTVPNATQSMIKTPQKPPVSASDAFGSRRIYGMKDYLSILQSTKTGNNVSEIANQQAEVRKEVTKAVPTRKICGMDDFITLLKSGTAKPGQGPNTTSAVLNPHEEVDPTGKATRKHPQDAPKTFSRMIYDKNSKQKQKQTSEQEAISNELERHISEYKKLKELHSHGKITVGKVDGGKAQHLSPTKQNPVLTSFLNAPSPIKTQVEVPRSNVPLSSAHIDQKEIMSLLQQQNNLVGRHYTSAETPHLAHTSQYQSQPKAIVIKAPNATVTGHAHKAPSTTIGPNNRALAGDGFQSEFNKMIGQTGLLSNNKAYLEYDKEPADAPRASHGIFNDIHANKDEVAPKAKGKSKRAPRKGKGNIQNDLVSVMDALLAQKTPSRGPNALELALNKSEVMRKQTTGKNRPNEEPNKFVNKEQIKQPNSMPKLSHAPKNNTVKPPGRVYTNFNLDRLIENEVAHQMNTKNYKIPDPGKLIEAVKNIIKQPNLHNLTQKIDDKFKQYAQIGTSTVTKAPPKKMSKPKPQLKPEAVQKKPVPVSSLPVQNAPIDLQMKPGVPKKSPVQDAPVKQFRVQTGPNSTPKLVEVSSGSISISKNIKIQKDIIIKPATMPKGSTAVAAQKPAQDKLPSIPEEYPLLDELMDKELLEEIDELSSDEDVAKSAGTGTKIQPSKSGVIGNETLESTQSTKDQMPSTNALAVDVLKAQKYVGMRVVRLSDFDSCAEPEAKDVVKPPNITHEKTNTGAATEPVSKIVLISGGLSRPQVEYPTSFIVSPVPNLALYQTTQYAAPVVNQVIIGNATSVRNTNALNTASDLANTGQNVVQRTDVLPQTSKVNTLCNTTDTFVPTITEAKPKKKIEILEQKTLNFDYVTRNKKRKVLHEVQEKQNALATEAPMKIEKTIVDSAKVEPAVEKEKVVRKDSERVNNKRQAILNREINQRCFYPPIPLIYEPIKTATIVANPNVVRETVLTDLASASPKTDEDKGKVIREGAKENSVNNTTYRRILLRSSNRVKTPENSGKVAKDATEKKPKATHTAKVAAKEDDVVDKTPTPKRVSKRNLHKKALLKKVEDKTILPDTNADLKETDKVLDFEEELPAVEIPKGILIGNKVPCPKIPNQAPIPEFKQRDNGDTMLKQTIEPNDKPIKTVVIPENTEPKKVPDSTSNVTCVNSDVQFMKEVMNAIAESSPKLSPTLDTQQPKINESSNNAESDRTDKTNKNSPETTIIDDLPELKTPAPVKTKTAQQTPSSPIDVDSYQTPLDYMMNVKINKIKTLPTKDGEPSKKCIQITLPNQKIYKVTISGAVNIDIRTLFANPSVKNIITSNWSQTKKYRLNIRHNPYKKEPLKVLDTQELNKLDPSTAEIMDTIDLLSDEEIDQNANKNIKTEFGVYQVVGDSVDVDRLQRDMYRKCSVKLIKHPDSFFEQTTRPQSPLSPSILDMVEIPEVFEDIAETPIIEETDKYNPAINFKLLVTSDEQTPLEQTPMTKEEVFTDKVPTDTEKPTVSTSPESLQHAPALICDASQSKSEAVEKVVELTKDHESKPVVGKEKLGDDVVQQILKETIIHKVNNEIKPTIIVSDDAVAREILKDVVVNVSDFEIKRNKDTVKNCDAIVRDPMKTSDYGLVIKDTTSDDPELLDDETTIEESKRSEDRLLTEEPVKEIVFVDKETAGDEIPKFEDVTLKVNEASDENLFVNKEKVAFEAKLLAQEIRKEKPDIGLAKETEDTVNDKEVHGDVVFVNEEVVCVVQDELTEQTAIVNDASDDIEFVSEEKYSDLIQCKETSIDECPVVAGEKAPSLISDKEIDIVNDIDDSSNSMLPEVIEIDSSSDEFDQNELDSLVPDPKDLPDISLPRTQFVQPEQKINELKNLLLNDLGVLVDDTYDSCEPLVQTKTCLTSSTPEVIESATEDPKLCQQCFVKLHNCDDLVERYKIQNAIIQKKCFIHLVNCDHMIQNHDSDSEIEFEMPSPNTVLYRSGSPSILNHIPWEDLDLGLADGNESDPIGRTSPVMEIFEIISSFSQRNKKCTRKINIMTCNAEWFVTKHPVYYNGNKFVVTPETTTPKSSVPSLLSMALKNFNQEPELPISPSRKRKLATTEETVVTKKSAKDIQMADGVNKDYKEKHSNKVMMTLEEKSPEYRDNVMTDVSKASSVDFKIMFSNVNLAEVVNEDYRESEVAMTFEEKSSEDRRDMMANNSDVELMLCNDKSVEVKVKNDDENVISRNKVININHKLVSSSDMPIELREYTEKRSNEEVIVSDLTAASFNTNDQCSESKTLVVETNIFVKILSLEENCSKEHIKIPVAEELQGLLKAQAQESNTNIGKEVDYTISTDKIVEETLNLDAVIGVANDVTRSTLPEELNLTEAGSTFVEDIIEHNFCSDTTEKIGNKPAHIRKTLVTSDTTEKYVKSIQNIETNITTAMINYTMEETKTPGQTVSSVRNDVITSNDDTVASVEQFVVPNTRENKSTEQVEILTTASDEPILNKVVENPKKPIQIAEVSQNYPMAYDDNDITVNNSLESIRAEERKSTEQTVELITAPSDAPKPGEVLGRTKTPVRVTEVTTYDVPMSTDDNRIILDQLMKAEQRKSTQQAEEFLTAQSDESIISEVLGRSKRLVHVTEETTTDNLAMASDGLEITVNPHLESIETIKLLSAPSDEHTLSEERAEMPVKNSEVTIIDVPMPVNEDEVTVDHLIKAGEPESTEEVAEILTAPSDEAMTPVTVIEVTTAQFGDDDIIVDRPLESMKAEEASVTEQVVNLMTALSEEPNEILETPKPPVNFAKVSTVNDVSKIKDSTVVEFLKPNIQVPKGDDNMETTVHRSLKPHIEESKTEFEVIEAPAVRATSEAVEPLFDQASGRENAEALVGPTTLDEALSDAIVVSDVTSEVLNDSIELPFAGFESNESKSLDQVAEMPAAVHTCDVSENESLESENSHNHTEERSRTRDHNIEKQVILTPENVTEEIVASAKSDIHLAKESEVDMVDVTSNYIEEVTISTMDEATELTAHITNDNLGIEVIISQENICSATTEEVPRLTEVNDSFGVDYEDDVQEEVVLNFVNDEKNDALNTVIINSEPSPESLESPVSAPIIRSGIQETSNDKVAVSVSVGVEEIDVEGSFINEDRAAKSIADGMATSKPIMFANIELSNKVNDSIFQETTLSESEETETHVDMTESTPVDYSDRPGIILKGIEFKDPIVGTCYIFRPLDDSVSDTASVKTDMNESIEEVDENVDDGTTLSPEELVTPVSPLVNLRELKCETPEKQDNYENVEGDLHVLTPKFTYKQPDSKNRSLKRKISTIEVKHSAKKYRKGKRIDYPKLTAATMKESAFSSEYKTLIDYIDSVKFSYSRPYHKNEVDVHDAFSSWPIGGPVVKMEEDDVEPNTDCFLFSEVPNTAQGEIDKDPLNKSLVEEMTTNVETEIAASDELETNFNMGFGEESGRVIQNLKEGGNISKFSAATLSDVKQTQPVLLSTSDDGDNDANARESTDDQKDKLIRSINYIQLKNKVRSFFAKIKQDLVANILKDGHECPIDAGKVFQNVPGLYCTEFMKPEPAISTVNVVQVGQLPVSAAAQNPVTIDPRVTQVSDASPSQCSVENSPRSDNNQANIKAEYTELTNADLSLPLVQVISEHNQSDAVKDTDVITPEQTVIPKEIEIRSEMKERLDLSNENSTSEPKQQESIDFHYENSNTNEAMTNMSNDLSPDLMFNMPTQPSEESFLPAPKQENGSTEKTDQIAHAMNAAGITTTPETSVQRPHPLVNLISQKVIRTSPPGSGQSTNNYQKTSINAMALQQALAQILPPPLNQNSGSEGGQQTPNTTHTPQVLHIVQGKNASGNQITLVDNSQQSVINTPNATQVLHIVQNKSAASTTSNGSPNTQNFSGLSLVDAGLQQGGNQLLHIVNTGNHKNANATGQLLKRVNLLTNLTNVQGGNEQKMVQFVCKSADGKSIHLNAPHQRSMVLRLQPIETPNVQANVPKPAEQDLSPTQSSNQSKDAANQQEIKSRSVYEENYAKFIQNSSTPKSAVPLEKSTSLPKFNQAFGKATFQEGAAKQNDINTNSHLTQDNAEAPPAENTINLDHLNQIGSPPMLVRKTAPPTSQAQQNLVQQIKQSIAPMNMTMHGGVIYTRQIPVNIGGGQTINLITVPTTELIDENGQKQPGEMETPIIKIVPQNQSNTEGNTEENNHLGTSNENPPTPQPQQVLTQMRIKLPMLSKTPQVVQGARAVRPAFFQIQRNMIGGANQGQVYQQLVLTAAPPLGQQTIRLPQAPTRQVKVQPETPSPSESQLSSSTLEQLREFDMVLEQVKERSTVQPCGSSNNSTTFAKLHTPSTDATDSNSSVTATSTSTEHTQQVLYSIGNSSTMNVAYVNRKATVTTPTTSTYVRSPDSSGIVDSPSSSSSQIPQTVTETPPVATSSTSEPSSSASQPKAAKVGSKSVKSRPKPATATPSTMAKVNNPIPPKTSTQKPLEDEQTTQRILYILAEYKEQVENSPDKDKPAPRRRSNPPSNPSGSSKRKKSSSSSRRHGCTRDHSPIGDDNCRTMGSEDSSCGTSQGDCTESCSIDAHSPQDSPRKVVRKLTFEQETPILTQPRLQAPRNVIVADGQTITVARSATGKPTTAVLMPANYILPVSMMKGGQQIAIVTNRGPKLLTVGAPPGEAGAANALLLQRLIGPAGLKPMLARPGVRHVRLPATALHNLQAFNIQAAVPTSQPPDSTASPAPAPTPPELVETRANSSPWTEHEPTTSEVKPERGSSPEASEPWHLQASTDTTDYTYEEPVTSRADNVDRTVLVVQKKDGSAHGLHRVTHISSAALRHKYAILEHELRLQKSLSEECEDLGVDSPSASELFPEAELLFAASPAHDHLHHTPQPSLLQSSIPQPDLDDQIATDHLLPPPQLGGRADLADDADLGLGDGIVTVAEDGSAAIALDQEEFARAHPNTTFHSEPTDVGEEVQPFSIASGLAKGRHITSTIFHSNSAATTVLMAAPQQTVISQATPETSHAQTNAVKYSDIDNMINSLPGSHSHELNLSSVLVKDDGLTRFDSILTDSRELHLSNTASAIVHPNVTQVIRRVCYDDDTKRDRDRFLMDENDGLIAGDDAKMSVAEESSRDATMDSIGPDDEDSSPERHAELFWESNSASASESRRPLDFSSDSDKCCKSPSLDETNSTDSSGVGTHLRLDSVIKEARGRERSGSVDGSSAEDTTHPPIRTYPPKRSFHNDGEVERSLSGKTRAGERSSPDSPEVRRRASNRGVVKRGCHCCNGSPAPPRPKKPRQRKPTLDFAGN